jgi:RimJ/RimL family protein N-acetyltransferase
MTSAPTHSPFGGQLGLRPMIEADLPGKVRWANDPRINEWVGMAERVDLEGTRRWFAAQQQNPRILLYTITFDGQPIGFTKLVRDEDGPTGEYYGMAIDPEYWGYGLGKRTSREMMRIAFEQEGWTRVWAWIAEWNERSLGLHQSLGFEVVGKAEHRKRHVDGTEHDVLIIELTSARWAARRAADREA